jgi:hypothetical protein
MQRVPDTGTQLARRRFLQKEVHPGPDRRTGLDDLRTVLRAGPGRHIHTLSWWRIAGRFSDAVGGSAGREDVACLVALNVPGNELASLLGDHTLAWRPCTNRALLLDRHDQRAQLIVPFVRPRPARRPRPRLTLIYQQHAQ